MKHLMVILTDTLGVLLIIAAPLLGWLPGPGGLPLFLAGLSLLALNHDWAQKLLDEIKSHAGKLTKKWLKKVPVIRILFWSVVLIISGIGLAILAWNTSAERYLGFAYLLVAILLVVMRKEKA